MIFKAATADKSKLSLNGDKSRIVLSSGMASSDAELEYSFGIEEEYFLVDSRTLEAVHSTPDDFFAAAGWATGGQAVREMLQAQLEVVTNIHVDVQDAKEELIFLRREASRIAAQFGLAIMAAGTHPTASWRESNLSPKVRYERMIEDLRTVGKRNMLCGMHIHVQLPDPRRRVQIMRAMIPYIPLFIALATSSPFWNGEDTGLKGYRLAAYDELPRTGLPELFSDETEYKSYLDALTCSGAIPDASHVWWSMRPSVRHPTLEMRAPDSCTRINDAIAVASLYRALARHLDRNNDAPEVSVVDRAIAVENKWRAQRYGVHCNFASKEGPIAVKTLIRNLTSLVEADASMLNSSYEVAFCNIIAQGGTSADHQLAAGGPNMQLDRVKQWIVQSTIEERLDDVA